MKDENGLHGVTWLILSYVMPQGWLSAAAGVIGCVYLVCSIIQTWRSRP